MVKKILKFIPLFIIVPFVNAVTVVRETSKEAMDQGTSSVALTIFVMIIIGFFALCLSFWVIWKIYKAISDYGKKRKDFLYENFEVDLKQCYIGKDNTMMKRNWKFFWLFWKRNYVYADTENGLKIIGNYNGETSKKENFYLISIHNKMGFKNLYKIILVPTSIKNKLIKKLQVDNKSVLVLDCEGIDNIGNTDYYYMPLIKDLSKDKFIDFADKIHKEYIESIVYRDVIKTNLLQYREGVIRSVEVNPNVHFKRRTE